MKTCSIPISETFVSLQGEGKLAGMPSFFIRMSGCNLRCRWCDTPYASWSPEHVMRSIEELVTESTRNPCSHVVITGGEPMMFAEVEPLCAELHQLGKHITIETAGTIARTPHCDLMSISPKLSNSTPRGDARDPQRIWEQRHEQRRLDINVLQSLIDAYPEYQLKFVVTQEDDLAEIETLLDQLTRWSPDDVMLMPEGVTVKSREEHEWIVRACLYRGWRFCPRLHIELFGNTRGT